MEQLCGPTLVLCDSDFGDHKCEMSLRQNFIRNNMFVQKENMVLVLCIM